MVGYVLSPFPEIGATVYVRSVLETSSETVARPRLRWVLLAFVVAALGFWRTYHGGIGGMWAEDLPIYVGAVRDFLSDRNPYNLSHAPMFFFYPPFFLELTGVLSRLVPNGWGGRLYELLDIVAIFALPLVLARYFFRQRWLGPLFALLVFFVSPRFTGVLALFGLNIASTLYCLAFVAAVPGLKRNRWEWFYLAVIFAALIKITFLALLLLPLLAARRQWLRSVTCAAVVVLANLGERELWPQLYSGYQWSLQQGILLNHSYGYGLFGIVATYFPSGGKGVGLPPYLVSGLISATLLLLMFTLRWQMERGGVFAEWKDNAQDGRWGLWLALVLMTIILVNPRQMQYDVDIALFAGFVVWITVLRTSRLLLLLIVLFVPSIFARWIIAKPAMYGMYDTFLLLITFGLGFVWVRREVERNRQKSSTSMVNG